MKSNLKWLLTRIKLSNHVLYLLRIAFARCLNSTVDFTRLNSLSRERRADVDLFNSSASALFPNDKEVQ